MSRKKTIQLNREGCGLVGDLKRALNRCSDKSKFKIVLCTNDPEEESIEVIRLKDLCGMLYNCLVDAIMCVNVCVREEKKSGTPSIYYEGDQGYNCGAKQLKIDIDKVLDKYHKERVEIDLGH